MPLTPTDEQACALDLFATGDNLAVEAGAGTGKTSTLQLMAASTTRTGQYVAFNRAIVDEADRKMPSNVSARTIHSLAFRAIGKDYSHRLDSPRMTSAQIARILGIDPFTVTYGSQRKVLQPGQLAGMVMRALDEFCKSADPEPGRQHFAYVDGIDLPTADGRRTYGNNNELQALLEPKLRQAWADATNVNGRLRYAPARYLKQWQLNDPTIACDFLMFDECQPPWSVVSTPAGPRRIADIEVGDRVVSYTKGNVLSDRHGSVVLGKTVRHHEGEMVVVETGQHTTRYTPNHIAMARIGAAFENRHILYLMAKGDRFRVGITKGRHGTGPGRSTGIMGRLREERGDRAWVLDVFATKAEAEVAEAITSLVWRLPETRFNEDRPSIGKFWASWDPTYSDAIGCLEHYGRDIRYPLIGTERRYMLGDRFTEVRACNLIDGMEVRDKSLAFLPISVHRESYSGPVVSLTVGGPATYIADGVITHNCQDVSPVMLAIVEAQQKRSQLVFVGDSQQSIYGWNGAVDAMSKLPDGFRSFLTQSFRFGPAVADVANTVLTDLEADLRIKGLPSLRSTVGKIADGVRPDAVLCRTNAGAVSRCLEAQAAGVAVYLAGGGDQVIKFAEGAADLQAGRNSWHPELSCFTTWGEVQDYVEQDELGGELALLVDLVDKFTPEAIISGLRHMPDETKAELTVTTAHKSKGREWNVVQLADDFGQQARPGKPDPEPKDPSDEEKRLLYVAVTRAQQHLDISQVPYFTGAA